MDRSCFVTGFILSLGLLLLSVRSRDISAEEVCRICDGCPYGSISCQETGRLRMVPNDLPNGIKKVIIVGQRFDSQFLSRQNISSYSMPGAAIQELTIMDCGLRAIEARTFSGLSSLIKLDVSKNSLSRIQGHTFSGLTLDLLRLDDNQGLTLDAEAFENLTVSSLSMQNCGLRSLSYEVFRPILQSGVLTTLRLTSNSLTALDARFEPFFRSLSFLSLARNPFVCDCKLMWLSYTLQRKRRADVDDAFPMINDDRLMISPDDDHPVCESPSRLRGKQVVSLVASDFFCGPPQMRAIEVDFSNFKAGQQGFPNSSAFVSIRCTASGSPEMRLAWFRRNHRGSELVRLPGSRELSPGVIEVAVHRSLLFMNSTSEVEELGDIFTCLGIDTYGNTSADLSLRWPNLPRLSSNFQGSEDHDLFISSNGEENYRINGQEPFRSDHLDDFFFMKKFTILELIGAVVGTFTATIVLFLGGYILLYMRHRRQYPKSPSKTVYPMVNNSGFPKFPDYQVLESSPNRHSQGHLEAIGNQACDMPNEKRRLMAKMEWTDTRRDARTGSSVYSECPTYDLPSNHLSPTPLPPVPPDPPPPSPPPVSTLNHFGTIGAVPLVYQKPQFLDPATAAAVAAAAAAVNAAAANGNGICNQPNNLLAQTLTTNAILTDMLTLHRRRHQLYHQQHQHQQTSSAAPPPIQSSQDFRY